MDPILDIGGGDVSAGEGRLTDDSADNVELPQDIDPASEGHDVEGDNKKPDFDIDELTSDGHEDKEDHQPVGERDLKIKDDKKVNLNKADQPDPKAEDKKDDPEEGEDEDKNKDKEEEQDDKPADEPLDKDKEQPKPKGRDYTGMPEPVVKTLKAMNNQQFAKVYPAIRQLFTEAMGMSYQMEEMKKQLTGKGIPNSWYEHPGAYQLSSEYQEGVKTLNQLDMELNFYQKQLVAIKGGGEYRVITGYDDHGNPQLSQPIKPTNEAEVQISQLLNDGSNMRLQERTKLGTLQQNFKGRIDNARTFVKDQVDKHIKGLPPELQPDPAQVKLMMDVIDPAMREHPLAYGYGQMFGVLMKYAADRQKRLGLKTQQARLDNDKRQSGPQAGKLPKNGKPDGKPTVKLPNGRIVPKEFDLDELTQGAD